MTIGVIDEVRKLGIGTKLLSRMYEHVQRYYTSVLAVYLHVIIYNSSALSFYDKNDFKRICVLKEWYEINGKQYDGILLYRPIENQLTQEQSQYKQY